MPENLLLGKWGPKSDRLLGDVWTPQSCDELHRFRIADVVKADIRWAAGQIHGISVSSSDYQNVHPLV